jgi:hypothetical protein
VDGERSPSRQPYQCQKLLSRWGALPIAFAHVNQKSCAIDGERSLCDTFSNWISASFESFSLSATPWFGTILLMVFSVHNTNYELKH